MRGISWCFLNDGDFRNCTPMMRGAMSDMYRIVEYIIGMIMKESTRGIHALRLFSHATLIAQSMMNTRSVVVGATYPAIRPKNMKCWLPRQASPTKRAISLRKNLRVISAIKTGVIAVMRTLGTRWAKMGSLKILEESPISASQRGERTAAFVSFAPN